MKEAIKVALFMRISYNASYRKRFLQIPSVISKGASMKEIIKSEYPKEYKKLVNMISQRVERGVEEAAKAVSKSQMETYWDAGKYIVEFEQAGQSKAEYGLSLLKDLAKDLTLLLGKGYSRPNLYNMRQFYLCYTESIEEFKEKLTWSHICELIRIEDPLERGFYEKQCIGEKWSVRTLQRQKKVHFFYG